MYYLPCAQAGEGASLDEADRGWGGDHASVVIVGLRDVGAAPAARHARLAIVTQQVRCGAGLGAGQHGDPRHHRRRSPALAGELAALI